MLTDEEMVRRLAAGEDPYSIDPEHGCMNPLTGYYPHHEVEAEKSRRQSVVSAAVAHRPVHGGYPDRPSPNMVGDGRGNGYAPPPPDSPEAIALAGGRQRPRTGLCHLRCATNPDCGMGDCAEDRPEWTPAHPDPEIAAELEQEARGSERVDVAAGYTPRRWRCDCGAEHGRGHFGTVGVHRCLACGYVGQGGTLIEPPERGEFPV